MRKKICMLVDNDVVNDSRVLKEADSLSRGNFDVSVVAMHNPGLKYFESCNGFKLLELLFEPGYLDRKFCYH